MISTGCIVFFALRSQYVTFKVDVLFDHLRGCNGLH